MLGKRKQCCRLWLIALLLPLCTGCSAIPGRHSFTTASHVIRGITVAPIQLRNAGLGRGANVAQTPVPGSQSAAQSPTHNVSTPVTAAASPSPTEGYLPSVSVEESQPVVCTKASVPTNSPTLTVVNWGNTEDSVRDRSQGHAKAVIPVSGQVPRIQQVVPIPVPQQVELTAVPSCEGCATEPCLPPAIQLQQFEALMERVANMEARLHRSNESIAALQRALIRANTEVARLTANVKHWQSEVQRLEVSMQSQHESDIASLTRISEMLGTLADDDGMDAEAEGAGP